MAIQGPAPASGVPVDLWSDFTDLLSSVESIGSFLLDPGLNIRHPSHGLTLLLGRPPQELEGHPFWDLMMVDDPERRLRESLDGKRPATMTTDLRHANGHRVPVFLSILVSDEATGRPPLAIVEKRGDQASLARSLRESELGYRTLFEESPIGLWELEFTAAIELLEAHLAGDRWGGAALLADKPELIPQAIDRIEIHSVNLAAMHLLKAEVPADLKTGFLERFPPSAYPALGKALVAISQGESVAGLAIPVTTLAGQERLVRWSLALVPGPRDSFVKVLASSEDITELDLIRQHLAEERDRGRLYVDLIAHDVKNLIQGPFGYMDILTSDDMAPEVRDGYLKQMRIHLEEIVMLLDKVEVLARVQSREPSISPQDLRHAVEHGLEIAQMLHPEVAIDLVDQLPAYGAPVLADEFFSEALANIISNSAKHSERGDLTIWVTGEPVTGGRCRLRISDDGPGIPDDLKERVFARFVKGQVTKRGRGLGMALTKAIIENSNGTISVEDRIPGKPEAGAAFVIELPMGGN